VSGQNHDGGRATQAAKKVRKLHLGIDEATKEIVAVDLTESRVHDSQRISSLLGQIPDPIGQVSGDEAYDTQTCYDTVHQRGATPTFVPQRTAHRREIKDATEWRAARNRLLQQIEEQGRSRWHGLSNCTRQSIAYNTLFWFKTLFGERLWARNLERQDVETRVKCSILNRLTLLGMPKALRVRGAMFSKGTAEVFRMRGINESGQKRALATHLFISVAPVRA
jgi:hypothetical protein